MERKTIIIAWRFSQNSNNCFDTDSFNNGYEIIKFYTPIDREEMISNDLYNTLKDKLKKATNLFAFIHKPNFNGNDTSGKNMVKQLEAFTNTSKNVFVVPFENGIDFIYEILDETNKENRSLKSIITAESIAQYFQEIETEVKKSAILKFKVFSYWSFLNAIEGNCKQPKYSLKELETNFPDFVKSETFQNVKAILFDSEGNNLHNQQQHGEIIKQLRDNKPTSTN